MNVNNLNPSPDEINGNLPGPCLGVPADDVGSGGAGDDREGEAEYSPEDEAEIERRFAELFPGQYPTPRAIAAGNIAAVDAVCDSLLRA